MVRHRRRAPPICRPCGACRHSHSVIGSVAHAPTSLERIVSSLVMTPARAAAPSKPAQRTALRAARRALSAAAQAQAARRLARRAALLPAFRRAQRVALYWPHDGEIDPRPLMLRAWRLGKRCYLPILVRGGTLRFVLMHPRARLRRNRFGISEPVAARPTQCAARDLDVIFTPLVGFDVSGQRLGMGGGFYDRSLAFLRAGRRRPVVVGRAHECQRVERVAAAGWDIPLAAVVSDRAVYIFRTS